MLILAIIIGALAMVVLSPIPIFGPIIAGLIAGGVGRVIVAGFLSGTIDGIFAGAILTGLLGVLR